MTPFELYQQANRYVNEGLIRRQEPHPVAGARTRREWMLDFLPRIGHPQQAFPAVHVAGTSGKGSVSVMIAEILRAARRRVGLHVSPYLQVSTEKLWVDGAYASAQEFAELVEWLRPAAEAYRGAAVPLHGIAAVALCLEYFRRQAVDVAVVEVGVGGRHDLTNVVHTRVAVVTSVGLDHLKTLGPTLEDIAWHKVGIIQPGCTAVVFDDPAQPMLLAAAQRQVQQVGANLRIVRADELSCTCTASGQVSVSWHGRRMHFEAAPLAMPGAIQARNAALALAACEELDPRGDYLDESAAISGLARARLPGRFESMRWPAQAAPAASVEVLLDGAHNPDKLQALNKLITQHRTRRLILVCGVLESKVVGTELKALAQHAAYVIATQPQPFGKQAQPALALADNLRRPGQPISVQPDPHDAFDEALAVAQPGDLVLLAGSLYLAGTWRQRWYSDQQVLAARTSWPSSTQELIQR